MNDTGSGDFAELVRGERRPFIRRGGRHFVFRRSPLEFLPRIGFAYKVARDTVVRGGYGIFYESFGSDTVDALQQGFSSTTTLVPSLDNGLTFQSTLQNPFPGGLLQPAGSALGLSTYLGQSLTILDPGRKIPYVQRWSLNVQRELPGRVLVDLGYLGNRGTRLATTQSYNNIPAQDLSTLNVRLLPYPEFGSITATTDAGSSWYHSFEARVEKRLTSSFTAQGTYTYSKAMQAVEYLNPTDPAPSHVISPYDRTHSLAITAIQQLPFGRGHRWLHSNRWLDLAVGGWSINGMYQFQSGFPLRAYSKTTIQ